MEEARVISAEEVRKANFDLADRVDPEGVTLSYNSESDTLSAVIGQPREGLTEHLLDDIFYRIDPSTLKILGVEIVAFRRDFLRKNKVARKVFGGLMIELLEKGEIILVERRREVARELLPILVG